MYQNRYGTYPILYDHGEENWMNGEHVCQHGMALPSGWSEPHQEKGVWAGLQWEKTLRLVSIAVTQSCGFSCCSDEMGLK